MSDTPIGKCTSMNLDDSYSDNTNNVQYLCTLAGWKPSTGRGAPTVACSPVNVGAKYADVENNVIYQCGEDNAWHEVGGGGGSGTVSAGTTGQIAYYAADGTTVSGTNNLAVDNSGVLTSVAGDVTMTLAPTSLSFVSPSDDTSSTTVTDGAVSLNSLADNTQLSLQRNGIDFYGATSGHTHLTGQDASTSIITLPNVSGTTVVTADAPLAVDAATGNLSITGGITGSGTITITEITNGIITGATIT